MVKYRLTDVCIAQSILDTILDNIDVRKYHLRGSYFSAMRDLGVANLRNGSA